MPPKPSWRVTCPCGWERECSSEWAASSAAKLHHQLGPLDVKHDARVDPPEGFGGGQQLPLTWRRSRYVASPSIGINL